MPWRSILRASAGAASFRRRQTLEECQSQAQQQVERLRQELEDDPGASNRRQQAARRRAARERSERIAKALGQLAQIESKRKDTEKEKARASTAECVNAISRNRGLRQFLVRGVEKVRAVALRAHAALMTVGG